MIPVLHAEQHWVCPNCTETAVTHKVPRPGMGMSQMHNCRGLKGLLAPMVPDQVKAKVEALERGDYLNGDLPQRDGEGNVVMAVQTTRDDGQDTQVMMPAASMKLTKIEMARLRRRHGR